MSNPPRFPGLGRNQLCFYLASFSALSVLFSSIALSAQTQDSEGVKPFRQLNYNISPTPAAQATADSTYRPARTQDLHSKFPCLEPSLNSNDLHVVIGGYKVDSCTHLYIAEMGLTNAKVITYRRLDPEVPLRSWGLRCGITVHERLLLPNHGLEGAAFYSYAYEFYNQLPNIAVMFIHGHGQSFHLTCEALFARARLYYIQAVEGGPMKDRVVSFTSRSVENISDYFGGYRLPTAPSRRLLLTTTPPAVPQSLNDKSAGPVISSKTGTTLDQKLKTTEDPFAQDRIRINADIDKILRSHNIKMSVGLQSCCASMIFPSSRIRRHPQELYADLYRYLVQEPVANIAARLGFEYMIFALLGSTALDDVALDFYKEAERMHKVGNYSTHRALKRCITNMC